MVKKYKGSGVHNQSVENATQPSIRVNNIGSIGCLKKKLPWKA